MDADALPTATYSGDTRAFESLVRSQAGRLHRIASRVTGDGSLADDVLQEAFLRVLRVPAAARPSRAAAVSRSVSACIARTSAASASPPKRKTVARSVSSSSSRCR